MDPSCAKCNVALSKGFAMCWDHRMQCKHKCAKCNKDIYNNYDTCWDCVRKCKDCNKALLGTRKFHRCFDCNMKVKRERYMEWQLERNGVSQGDSVYCNGEFSGY